VPEEEKKSRNQRLLELGAKTGLARNSAHVGQVRRTFVEQVAEKRDGEVSGRTIHGVLVSFAGRPEFVGREVDVKIEGASAYGLSGVLA
jgi:tRNA-2-methylthio-N6-dimethylallyladenosine synthase